MSFQSIKIAIKQDKSLQIDFPELAGAKSSLVISPFSKEINWCLYVGDENPEPMSYLSEAAVSLGFLEKAIEGRRWLKEIPEEILTRLGNHYQGMEFVILYHIKTYQAAYDLFIANPTLLWYMLFMAKKENWSEEKVVALLKLRSRDILKKCHAPDTSSAVKLFKILSFDQYNQISFFTIQQGLRLANYSQFNHHEVLDYRLFKILVRHPGLIASSIMLKYDPESWQYKTEARFIQIKALAQRLGELKESEKKLNNCRDLVQVEKLYSKLIKKHAFKKSLINSPNNNFPKPPVQGNDWIIPLQGTRDLVIEANEMNHCAQIYEKAIIKGSYFIYKVLAPERATLGVEIHGNNIPPSIDQLVSHCNDAIEFEIMHQRIYHWLYDQGKEIYFNNQLKRVRAIRKSEKTFLRKLLLVASYTIDFCSAESVKSNFLSTLEGKLKWALKGDVDADEQGIFLSYKEAENLCFDVFDFLTPEIPELEIKIINEKFTNEEVGVIDDLVNKCLQNFEQDLKDYEELRMRSFTSTIDTQLHDLWQERILVNGTRS